MKDIYMISYSVKGIKNLDDFYKVFDVNEDGDVTAEDAQQILKYYACKAAGLVKQ